MARRIATTAGLAFALALGVQAASPATAAEGGPAAAIGRVNAGNGAYCTGALIADNIVVTAAHCLIDPRSRRWLRADSLHFLPGYHLGAYDHHARVAHYMVSPGYNAGEPTRNPADDWALLVLTDRLPPQTSPLEAAVVGAAAETVSEVMGYASHRKYALSTSSPCRTRLVGAMLMGECKAERGMSGAPLIQISTGDMIGIQVAAGRQNGRDVLVGVPAAGWQDVLRRLRTPEIRGQGSGRLQ
ncbi:trypsin-like serine peptidase [Arvimicrobium flavum]|uniref:trypsin-like serine peptidase n=1 Tax=Arvimicrobium flavum TaxID=3393320 RepID=UPI00237A76D1|nr:trypsin-like serine protease [Mesorhizobium shangrilense]